MVRPYATLVDFVYTMTIILTTNLILFNMYNLVISILFIIILLFYFILIIVNQNDQ